MTLALAPLLVRRLWEIYVSFRDEIIRLSHVLRTV